LAWGRYKSWLCLVAIVWKSLFDEKRALLYDTKDKENKYCDARARIPNSLYIFLNETVLPYLNSALIASSEEEK
jgi:hypothetical protein